MRKAPKCYRCSNKRDVPGDCHIRCIKPDPEVKGHPHGVKNGWFIYPSLFDPAWMVTGCGSFEAIPGETTSTA